MTLCYIKSKPQKDFCLEIEGLSPKNYQHVPCVICNASESRGIAKKGQFGWPTFVSICKQCGLVHLNPRWRKEDYEKFYREEYDQFYRFDQQEAAEKELRKAKILWERLATHTPGQFKSVLDIGCGLGWNLHYLAQQMPGISISGIEPSATCARHFVDQIGGELIASDVDSDWHLANVERFDLIVFRHVLEHLLNPVATLQKVRQAMADGGRLYIAVPDMMNPDGSLRDFWFRCVHTYYYSTTTLSHIATLAGLQPIVLEEQDSELWGIFRKVESTEKQFEAEIRSVYWQQMRALRKYQGKRLFRSVLLTFSPRKLSRLLPTSLKALLPKELKKRFRNLVYRH